jgi:hypothetical protein
MRKQRALLSGKVFAANPGNWKNIETLRRVGKIVCDEFSARAKRNARFCPRVDPELSALPTLRDLQFLAAA